MPADRIRLEQQRRESKQLIQDLITAIETPPSGFFELRYVVKALLYLILVRIDEHYDLHVNVAPIVTDPRLRNRGVN